MTAIVTLPLGQGDYIARTNVEALRDATGSPAALLALPDREAKLAEARGRVLFAQAALREAEAQLRFIEEAP